MRKKTWRRMRLSVAGLRHLKNVEFFNAYDEITHRLVGIIFTDDYMNRCMTGLLSHKEAVALLRAWKRAHDVSKLIDSLVDDSRDVLMGLRDAINASVRLAKPENKEASLLLVDWINDSKHLMGTNTRSYQQGVVRTLNDRLEEDQKLGEALETFGLDTHFDDVKRMHGTISTYQNLRDSDNTSSKDVRERFRELVLDDMRLTFSTLEGLAKYDSEEGDTYYDLCLNLERYLVSASTPKKARATRSENERAENDELPEEGITSTYDSDESSDAYNIDNDESEESVSENVEDDNNSEVL